MDSDYSVTQQTVDVMSGGSYDLKVNICDKCDRI